MGAGGFTYKLALKNGGEKKQNKTKTLIDDKPESAGGFTHELAVEKLAWQNQEQNPDGYFWNEFG